MTRRTRATRICAHVNAHMCTCGTHICAHANTHTHTHTYIYIYIYMRARNTHTHTHMRTPGTHMCVCLESTFLFTCNKDGGERGCREGGEAHPERHLRPLLHEPRQVQEHERLRGPGQVRAGRGQELRDELRGAHRAGGWKIRLGPGN